MTDQSDEVREKITEFFKGGLMHYGKEICLESNQNFHIYQIIGEEDQQSGEACFRMQYGYPQSGCVSLGFSYFKESKALQIFSIEIDAPPADKEMTLATFAPQFSDGGLTVGLSFGPDMGTVSHDNIDDIMENPNALRLLDFAITDLEHAEVLGECRAAAPIGSKMIPCTVSTDKPKQDAIGGNAK